MPCEIADRLTRAAAGLLRLVASPSLLLFSETMDCEEPSSGATLWKTETGLGTLHFDSIRHQLYPGTAKYVSTVYGLVNCTEEQK